MVILLSARLERKKRLFRSQVCCLVVFSMGGGRHASHLARLVIT
jgi:hypothetical protein